MSIWKNKSKELKDQKKNEQYLSPAQFAEKMRLFKIDGNKTGTKRRDRSTPIRKADQNPMSQFEEKEGSKEASWKDVVFKGSIKQ